MEVKMDDLSFDELLDLFKAMEEFVEFLDVELKTEVEVRKK